MAELQETVVQTKELVYEYQAVDDLGRPLGAVQVFKGATAKEILDKIANANKNLIKLNRELNKKIRLGEFEKDTLPDDAMRMTSNLLQPRELTLEEKAQFARDILDPEKFDEVNSKLIEAQLGAKPEDIRNRINSQEKRLENIEARQEAEAFVFANPDYYVCPDNFRTITSWVIKNNLKPVRENFQLAYDTLKAAGVLTEAPLAPVSTIPPAPLVPQEVSVNIPAVPVPIAPAPPAVPVMRQPSGLNREISSNIGTPPSKTILTIRDIERMPSAEYKNRLVSDPEFGKIVDELYKNQKINPNQR